MAVNLELPGSDLVSVIVPCFNCRPFVEEAIASAFAQSHRSLEVIVVDDGSTDGSWELLLELRAGPFPELILLSHPDRINLGVSSSRALGVRRARGSFLAFLDADDVFLPDKLAAQLAALERYPEAVLCHTAVRVIGNPEEIASFSSVFNHGPTGAPYHFRRQSDYLIRHGICNSSVLIRAECLHSLPIAVQQRYQFEDWLCWCLLAAAGPFLFIHEPLLEYRMHPGSATALMVRSRLDQLLAMLEFKLALLARTESSWHALRVLLSTGETLRQLIVEYLWDPSLQSMGKRSEVRPNGLVLMILGVGKAARRLRRRRGPG